MFWGVVCGNKWFGELHFMACLLLLYWLCGFARAFLLGDGLVDENSSGTGRIEANFYDHVILDLLRSSSYRLVSDWNDNSKQFRILGKINAAS
jgi:hypothetical protein